MKLPASSSAAAGASAGRAAQELPLSPALGAALRRVVAHTLRRGALAAAMLAAGGIAALPAHAADPVYSWKNAKIGGTGYVTGMIAHPKQLGLYYARTDVGGAYRYDAAISTWTPLNDWAPPALSYINGIDSIAFDPSDNAQQQYGDAQVITGDPKTFGTVYLGARGVMVGTSAN